MKIKTSFLVSLQPGRHFCRWVQTGGAWAYQIRRNNEFTLRLKGWKGRTCAALHRVGNAGAKAAQPRYSTATRMLATICRISTALIPCTSVRQRGQQGRCLERLVEPA